MAQFVKRSSRSENRQSGAADVPGTGLSATEKKAKKQIHSLLNRYDGAADTDAPPAAEQIVNADFKDAPPADRPIVAQALRGSDDFDPMPESQPEIEHKIHTVQIEHSAPGEEPEDGKFADAATDTVEVVMPEEKAPQTPSDEKTRKFIKTEPETAQPPAEGSAETAAPSPREKPKKSRHAPDIDTSPTAIRYPEYTNAESGAEIKKFLRREKKTYLIRLAICFGATLLSVILSVLADLASPDGALGIFGGNGTVYGVVMLILFLIGVAPLAGLFSDAFSLLKKKRAGSDAAVLLLWAAVLLQNLTLLTAPEKIHAQCRLYNAAVLTVTFCCGVLRLITLTRATAGFRTLIAGKKIKGLGAVRDAHRSERIGQGILEADSKIGYAFHTSFIDSYVNASLTDDPAIPLYTFILPLCIAAALIVAIAAGVAAKDAHSAISAFTAVITVTSPLPVSVTLKSLLNQSNAALEKSGGVIPNYASALSFASNDAVIFDAADIYGADALDILGARAFNGFSLYDAILFTSSVLIESKSPLGSIFLKAIDDKTELLPKSDSIIYEEKQGLSGWIYDKRVLVGTREMLLNHNIDVLPEEKERKYLDEHPNRRVLYLAVDGALAALFLVSYNLSRETVASLHYLSRHGYTILLRSTDPNINESFTEYQLSLPRDTVKVINAEAADYFKLCREEELPNAGTCGFSVGDTESVLQLAELSVKLKNAFDITRIITVVGSFLGLILVALLMIFGSASSVAGYYLVLLQAIWAIVGGVVCRITERR